MAVSLFSSLVLDDLFSRLVQPPRDGDADETPKRHAAGAQQPAVASAAPVAREMRVTHGIDSAAAFAPIDPGAASDPEQLHPALWRAHRLGGQRLATPGTGYVALDAELPGGGWPTHALTELLLPHPGVGEIRLLAPALAAVQRGGGSVMLFDPPAALCGWTLTALGLDLGRLVVVRRRDGLKPSSGRERAARGGRAHALLPAADVLWALEHALKSGEVGAVLAWAAPRLSAEPLRRLQLAAASHDGPAFLVRDADERQRPSAAPLRLWLAPAGPDELALRIVKRRGPPRVEPLVLTLAPVLSAPARARALRRCEPAVRRMPRSRV